MAIFKRLGNVVQLKFTKKEIADAMEYYDSDLGYRDWITMVFKQRGFMVVKFEEIKFFYPKNGLVVEANVGQSIMSI